MSSTDVSRFVTRALDDAGLRSLLESNPDRAFADYDLTSEEKDLIRSADEQKLRQAGLDPMTARSWLAFHNVGPVAPDRPDLPGDLESK